MWNKQYTLSEFSATTNFKSYDELKTRLDNVLAGTTVVGTAASNFDVEPVETFTVDTKEEPVPSVTVSDDDDENTMSYFEKLASDD